MIKQVQSNLNTFKVQYKGKVYNLGKGINSFASFEAAIWQRFPEFYGRVIFNNHDCYNNQSFNEMLSRLLQEGRTSVKINISLDEKEFVKSSKQDVSPFQKKTKRYSFDEKQFEETEDTQPIDSISSKAATDTALNHEQVRINVIFEYSNFNKQQGEEYEWSFEIQNKSGKKVPDSVKLFDRANFKMTEIGGLEVGETKKIKTGPFQQNEVGSFMHLFRLMWFEGENKMGNVSKNFGFFVEITAQKNSAKCSSILERVKALREFSTCEKSSENIVLRLKEMGIGEKQAQNFDDESLLGLMENLSL